MLDAQTMWYVTRATGVVSLVLLTGALVLGITEAVRWASDRWPRFVTAGLHKNVSLLATTFIAAHVATAIIDGFAPIGWLDAIVPFRSAYRPLWLGFGAVAVDLLIALVATSLLRRRIGPRVWRGVHWCAYACWPVALLHGLGTGTDTTTSWLLGLEGLCLGAVVVAIWWRIASGWPAHQGRRILAASTSALLPLVIALWTFAGPLQPGWARRSGTPESLLGHPVATVAASASTFDAAVTGTITETQPDRRSNATVTIDLNLSDGASGTAKIVIQGPALSDGGIQLQTGRVALQLAGDPGPYAGDVTDLSGGVVSATVQAADGTALGVQFDLSIDSSNVTGTVHASSN
jgi:sulfoxide reductase heme-binding subunit YedZ